MDDKLRTLDNVQLDVFEALKRALRWHSLRRQPQVKATHIPEPNPDSEALDHADEDPEKLLDITTNAHDVLFEAQTVFPFTLFPDTVTIDREKVTIANRFFFKVATINSTPIADIQSVEADVGPFFGTVKTTSKYFMNNPREVHFLSRDNALKMQHLLQGYIIAHQRNVDCNSIDSEQLVILLNDLGQGVND